MNPVVDAVAGPFLGFATAIIDRLFPDKEADAERRSQLILQAQQMDADLRKAQIAVNQQEAQSSSLFVAGWRPAVGWCCAAAFAYHFILLPFLSFILTAAGHPIALPPLDMTELSTVLMGMLGLGGLRTIERVKGVQRDSL